MTAQTKTALEPSANRSKKRTDGWVNILAGVGKKHDKTRYTQAADFEYLDKVTLSNIWNSGGIGSKVVSCVAEDMTRAWIEIEGDDNGDIAEALDTLKAETAFYEAIVAARLFGGSLIIVGTADTDDLAKPRTAQKGAQEVKFLKVYSKPRITIFSSDIVTDPTSAHFEDVAKFSIQTEDGRMFDVHRSRCLLFKGTRWATETGAISWEDRYWGMSALQQIWEEVRTQGSTMQAVANLMLEYNISVYNLSNLGELIAQGNDRAVSNRLDIINMSKSMINGVILGENEKYSRETATTTGLDKLLELHMLQLSAVSNIPTTRLFGRSASGLNATGENDMRSYYDTISSKQKTQLRPPLQELLNIIAGEKVSFKFNPLWVPSESQLIEMRSKQASTDKTYIDAQVLSAEEVRSARFLNGYSFSTSVEDETIPTDEKDAQIEELTAQLTAAQSAQTATPQKTAEEQNAV